MKVREQSEKERNKQKVVTAVSNAACALICPCDEDMLEYIINGPGCLGLFGLHTIKNKHLPVCSNTR